MPELPTKPIGAVKIYDPQGAVEFRPEPDLTLQELADVVSMLAWLGRPGHWGWRQYLKDKALERHFRDVER